MTSLYYKICSTGYTRTYDQPPVSADLSKQIPVFRTVSQFMNIQPSEPVQQKELSRQQSQPKKSVDFSNQQMSPLIGRLTQIDTINPSTKQNSTSINQTIPQNLPPLDINSSKIKQIYQQGMKSSSIKTVIKPHLNQNLFDVNTEENTVVEIDSPRINLECQLQKQRALRNNLQKSYKSLLQRLQKKNKNFEQQSTFGQTSIQKMNNLKHYTMTDRTNNVDSQQEGETSKGILKTTPLRKSCCDFKQMQNSPQYYEQEQEYPQQEFQINLQQEKMFQAKLQQEIFSLKTRIQQMQSSILKRELYDKDRQCKLLQLQKRNYILKSKLQNQHLINNTANSLGVSMNKKAPREHMHYIFTILIIFLCLAVNAKK